MTSIILCILAADFITGVAHWAEDAYFLPTWPIVGKLVAVPNIRHHADPTAMVREGTAVDRNIVQVTLAAFVCMVAYVFGCLTWQLRSCALIAVSNEIHAWHHGGGKNPVARLLCEMGLVQTPSHHSKHHGAPYNTRYCILTCWLNPILDRIQFWETAERLLAQVGIRPNRMAPARQGV